MSFSTSKLITLALDREIPILESDTREIVMKKLGMEPNQSPTKRKKTVEKHKPVEMENLKMIETKNNIIVSGNTGKFRESFHAIGGEWNTFYHNWSFPKSISLWNELNHLITGVTPPIPIIAVEVKRPIKETSIKIDGNARNISISEFMGQLVVSGNTQGIESVIRSLGGKWSVDYYGWVFPLSSKSMLQQVFE